jgi:hypothetical protein
MWSGGTDFLIARTGGASTCQSKRPRGVTGKIIYVDGQIDFEPHLGVA